MLKNDPLNECVFDTLGTVLLCPRIGEDSGRLKNPIDSICELPLDQFEGLLQQAETQRVLRRFLEALRNSLPDDREDLSQLLDSRLAAERTRIEIVLATLQKIVSAFENRGLPVVIMKTLDHWPDTGSDIDLLAAGADHEVCDVLENTFRAVRQPQSWGDRLAHKFNFHLPKLNELVEVHINCLGQTGEQQRLAAAVLSRRSNQCYGNYSLPVPVAEDRIIIATLQRMYRHYYIRLTDIVNIFQALAQKKIHFEHLRAIADESSVWPGVATLLEIVCQQGVRYGGSPVTLPAFVRSAARFNATRTYVDRKFLRVPIMPEATNLYLQQLAENGRNRNLRALARLSLLPLLASAAFVAFRLTGNDKGIW
jgi:putative nucleotidyltransferase-like protein